MARNVRKEEIETPANRWNTGAREISINQGMKKGRQRNFGVLLQLRCRRRAKKSDELSLTQHTTVLIS